MPASLARCAQHPDARRLIHDPDAAASEWYKKYGCTQVNHLFVVNFRAGEVAPDVIEEIFRMLAESKKAAGLTGKAIDPLPFGVEAVSKSLSIVSQYAHEQKIIPRRYEMDDLFDKAMQALRI